MSERQRGSSVERLLRSAVRALVGITLVIALAGGALVALTRTLGPWALWTGAAIMLASPWIAYAIIVKMYKKKVMEAK